MKNSPVTQAYKAYYDNVLSQKHNNPELIGKWGEDPSRLETQIMCHKMGVKVPDSNMYEEGGEKFGPQRWPYDAAGNPNYSDPPIQYIIRDRMKCIGTTWWDWKNKRSIGLGFDFDSIAGHAEGVGVSDSEIAKLDKIDVPWLEVIRSTKGMGRHIYIWFKDPYPVTMNHTEHAALARSYIPLIAQHTGLDVEASVDVCGSVMWIHHESATKENHGYELIKPATQILTAAHVPPNWRDNLEVVTGSRTKVRVQGWTADGLPTEGDELDEMTQAHARVPLDETHLKILEDLEHTGHTSLWVHDHYLWQGHTAGLKAVYEDWKERGTPMRGLFDTNSLDSDPGKANCLCADTKVITREGVKPIGELAGKNAEIITYRGKWMTVPFKSYGEQEVFAVTLENRNQRKVIRATGDHRWYVTKYRSNGKRKTKVNFGDREEVVTKDLTEGRILVQTKPQCNHTPSVVGIQHGLVWGDGTNGGGRRTSSLSLFGKKDAELLKYFAGHPQRPITRSVGGVEVWNLPHHFKSLVPLHYDKAYLYGWLAGYFAADGCVSGSGSCIIRSADKNSIEHVRQVCHILGIETSKITSRVHSGYKDSMMYTTILKASDLSEEFFLLTHHRERWGSTENRQHHYWRVVSVEPAGREEVFCCTVPKHHCFVLEDFILIGNCFMRPKLGGGWDVYRFGEGCTEHPLWGKQGKWTHTTFNYPATLRQICCSCGGFEAPDGKGGYMFSLVEEIANALKLLSSNIEIPRGVSDSDGRQFVIRPRDDGKIILVIGKTRGDKPVDFPRYAKTSKGWERVVDDAVKTTDKEIEDAEMWSELDNQFRALKVGSRFEEWVLRDEEGDWITHPRENVKLFLVSEGHTKNDVIFGQAIFKCWKLVNRPFESEYPGGREWNRNATQFLYTPIELQEGEHAVHPTWNRLMRHCGIELDQLIPNLPWCKEWGIENGGDYLTAWVACMFQNPYGKLPYLFFYGPQNSGKSSFHEALALLVTKGVCKADRALTSKSGYNGELTNAILGVVDEVDISKTGGIEAYNKLKEWVTGETLSVHAKYKQVEEVRSTLHLVQMANSRASLPVFPGDTRITAMNVPSLEEEIPRDKFRELLKREAPHFMRTLLDFEIPEATSRIMLPIIETQGKYDAAAVNNNPLDDFIDNNCYAIPGRSIALKEFKEAFFKTLEEYQETEWKNDREIVRILSERFPVGRGRGNVQVVGNISFQECEPMTPFTKDGSRLKREDEV